MVLYNITLVPLLEELRGADPNLLSPFYADDVAFNRLARRSAAQLCLLMDRGGHGWKYWEFLEKVALTRMKEVTDGAVLNRLWRATDNAAWPMAIFHLINGTEL